MRSTSVVNDETSPTQGDFGVCPPQESERPAYLVGIHGAGSAVASLDSRGVRCCVSELFECFIDPLLTAVAVAEFDVDDTHTLSVLDDLCVKL